MKLAVYADSNGKIAGLAVCQATFSNERNGSREISIRAEPLHKLRSEAVAHDAISYETHMLELPSDLAYKPHYEVAQALHDIHASMYLDLTQSEPRLCKCADRHPKRDC